MTPSQTSKTLNELIRRIERSTGARANELRRQLLPLIDRIVAEEVESRVAARFAEQIEARWAREVSRDPERRGYFRLPLCGKAETYAPLERAVAYAAARCGKFPYQTAVIMTYFLEGIADEISKGHQVRLPGFGMFTPYAYGKTAATTHSQPRFIPARTLRGQVRRLLPVGVANALNARAESYRRSHHPASQVAKSHDSVPQAMRWMRSVIRNEGGALAET